VTIGVNDMVGALVAGEVLLGEVDGALLVGMGLGSDVEGTLLGIRVGTREGIAVYVDEVGANDGYSVLLTSVGNAVSDVGKLEGIELGMIVASAVGTLVWFEVGKAVELLECSVGSSDGSELLPVGIKDGDIVSPDGVMVGVSVRCEGALLGEIVGSTDSIVGHTVAGTDGCEVECAVPDGTEVALGAVGAVVIDGDAVGRLKLNITLSM